MDTTFKQGLLCVMGMDQWILLDPDDTRRFRPDITDILLKATLDHLHIIWREENGHIWESKMSYFPSIKKMIMTAIHDPVYRGTIMSAQFEHILATPTELDTYTLSTLSGSLHNTLKLSVQELNEPTSPNDQS